MYFDIKKPGLFLFTLALQFIFNSQSFGQNKLKVKITNAVQQPVKDVQVILPNNKKVFISTGEEQLELGTTITSELIDQLKFKKAGWKTSGLEFYDESNELHVTLEKIIEIERAVTNNVNDSGPESHSKNIKINLVHEKGELLKNVKVLLPDKAIIVQTGSFLLPSNEIQNISFQGYNIKHKEYLRSDEVVFVLSENGDTNIEESIRDMVNKLRIDKEQTKQSNIYINKQISNILLRLKSEKGLTRKEKDKLRIYIKELSNELKYIDGNYIYNKLLRDSLMEKLNFLLLEKDSINKLHQLKIIALEKEKGAERIEARKHMLVLALVTFLLLVIIGLLVYLIRKVNNQKSGLQNQNEEIFLQKEKTQLVYKELSDNIASARLIQNTILPGKDAIENFIPNFAVFYQPRDVVSGDFYWFFQNESQVYVAVIDCTGHGVAGAFMSFIGYEILNQIVRDEPFIKPGEILTILNKELLKTLKLNNQGTVNAGMDISLCRILKNEKLVEYAGANNALYFLRKNSQDVEKYTPDRQGIGGRQKRPEFEFATQTVPYTDGDSFMLFSDGYADQIGGPGNDQKFLYSRLRKLFTEIADLPSIQKEKKLAQQFDQWKNSCEQLDDVLVICFTL